MHLNLNPKYVPTISDDRAAELLKQIRPLLRKDGKLFEIELPPNLAQEYASATLGARVPADNISVVNSVMTYHLSNDSQPRPTIQAVLAQLNQLPKEVLDGVHAFEVRLTDLTCEPLERFGFTGHQLLTLLYRAK